MGEGKILTSEEVRADYHKLLGIEEGDRACSMVFSSLSERLDESRRETRHKEWSEYGFERAIFYYTFWEYCSKKSDKIIAWEIHDIPTSEKALTLTGRRKKYEEIYKAITSSGRELINLDHRLKKFTLPQLDVTAPFHDNDEKNTAFTLLFLWLDHSIKLDHLRFDDLESLRKISVYYYYLAKLHLFVFANHDEVQDFVKRFDPDFSLNDALVLMREDFATYSGPIFEYWYEDNPQARKAVNYCIEQNANQSEGGKVRAQKHKDELLGEFADAVAQIARKHSDWGTSRIAKKLAEEYRAKEGGKQLTTDAMRKRLGKLYEEHGGKENFLKKYD